MKVRELVDSVDTPGGHIIIAVAIGSVGVAIAVVAHWYGHDMVAEVVSPMIGFYSIAAYAMRGTDKANSQVVTTSSTHVESPVEKKQEKP